MKMAKTFNNLKELEGYLKTVVNDVLSDEVAEMVKTKQQDHIMDDVYLQYNIVDGQRKEPYAYDRRYYEGGLIDRDNIVAKVEDGTLTVTNTTKGQDGVDNLAGLIEYGDNSAYGQYDWKYNKDDTQDQYLNPRPFIENTRKEIAEKNLHVSSMKKGIEKRLGKGTVI